MTSPASDNLPAPRVLNQSVFLARLHDEIARCLRTRRHLSVALLVVQVADKTTTLSTDTLLGMAEEIARNIRPYDLVALSPSAEVMLLFPEASREIADIIIGRLRTTTATVPEATTSGSRRVWGLATWPADGADTADLLAVARRRLSAA